MPIENISQELLIITFSDRQRLNNELKEINEMIYKGRDCNVLINLRGVELINSTNLRNLIILRQFLNKMGRQLVLYNVSLPIRCIFVVTGLRDIFNFAKDRDEAMEMLTLANPV